MVGSESVLKRYFSGLQFGMLLQLAVGPMSLMVFNTAKNSGFLVALSLMAAVALVDAFYILLASLGVSKLLEGERTQQRFRVIGAAVLILFGANIVLGVVGVNLIPGLGLSVTSSSIFVQGLVMTLSNPLTIAFWGSVLTAKLVEEQMERRELAVFSVGLVSATVFFMTFVAALGTVLAQFLSPAVSNVLNVCVGAVIIGFGIKMLLKKN